MCHMLAKVKDRTVLSTSFLNDVIGSLLMTFTELGSKVLTFT